MTGMVMASTTGSMCSSSVTASLAPPAGEVAEAVAGTTGPGRGSPPIRAAASGAALIPVSHSPHRDDPPGFGRRVLDLLAQPSHMDGHGGLVAEVPAPHAFQQLLA